MTAPPTQAVRTRIAPSPTGEPHIGNMYIALVDWALARQTGGQFVLRIEDTDRARFLEGAEATFIQALEWLGLDPDEGPDRGGPVGPYRQSERLETYRDHTERLLAAGSAYRCFCAPERLADVRAERQKAGKATGYDRRCRALDPDEARRRAEAGQTHTVRLAVPLEGQTRFTDGLRGEIVVENARIDDQVLLKSDGFPTYHLACVVDDRLMSITDVVRAEEWITSTPKHILLYEAFGWDPPRFHHMPLIRNPDRSKLSKRRNPTNVLGYHQEGYLAEAVVNFLGRLGHSMPDGREVFTRQEFLEAFSLERVTTTAPVFDTDKFAWLNGQWIRRLPAEDLAGRLAAGGFMPGGLEEFSEEERLEIVRLVQQRLHKLSEFADGVAFFIEPLPYEPELLIPTKGKKKKPSRSPEETRAALERLPAALAELREWTAEAMEETLRALADEMEWKPRELFMTLRVAVTCRTVSTPLFETMAILGRDECLARIEEASARAADLD